MNHTSFSTISFLFGHRLIKKIMSDLMQVTLIATFLCPCQNTLSLLAIFWPSSCLSKF